MAGGHVASAVFHVGHHDDCNDVAERAADDPDFRRSDAKSSTTRTCLCSDVDLRSGLRRDLVRIQRAGRHQPVVAPSAGVAFFINDKHERVARRHVATRRRHFSIHSAQTNLLDALSRTIGVNHDALARR